MTRRLPYRWWQGFDDPNLAQKILDMCEVDEDGCPIWQGQQHRGYGVIYRFKVHRVWYIIHNGPVPEGLELAHSCRKKLCVMHGEPKTHQYNVSEPDVKGRHAPTWKCDHPRTPENTYEIPSTGFETCYTCSRNRTRKSKGYPPLTYEQAIASRKEQ